MFEEGVGEGVHEAKEGRGVEVGFGVGTFDSFEIVEELFEAVAECC